MKKRYTTAILFIVLLSALYAMAYLRHRANMEIGKLQFLLDSQKSGRDSLEDAFASTRYVAYKHRGRAIDFGDRELYYIPKSQNEGQTEKQPSLLLVFSELSCNVCQDEESAFGNEIARELGPGFVRAVIHGSTPRYIQSYIRLNQVDYPIYYDEDMAFMKDHEIVNTPLVLLLDENDRVIETHYPLPGREKLSEPFHDYVRHFFGL